MYLQKEIVAELYGREYPKSKIGTIRIQKHEIVAKLEEAGSPYEIQSETGKGYYLSER